VSAPAAPKVAALIDHTLLKADATSHDIEKLCEQAIRYGFAAVCVNPWAVRPAVEHLAGTKIAVCSVAGFPLGGTTAWVKASEAQGAVADGATEIDVVINVGALKSGRRDLVEEELSLVRRSIGDALMKVILEMPLLPPELVAEGCRAALGCGADFVKTCTGFGPRGVTVGDVVSLRRLVGPAVGVKAAGGIRSLAFARELLAAGATRLGSSSGVAIAEEERAELSGG